MAGAGVGGGGQPKNSSGLKEADREKRDMFSSVIEQLDWGKAEGIMEPPQNTPTPGKMGLGALSSPI